MSPPGPSPAALADTLDNLSKTLAEASKSLRDGSSPSLLTSVTRKAEVAGALKDTIEAIQNPQDAFLDQMVLVSRLVALRIFVKWKVFDAIPATGSITYAELAAKVDAGEEIVSTCYSPVLVFKFRVPC